MTEETQPLWPEAIRRKIELQAQQFGYAMMISPEVFMTMPQEQWADPLIRYATVGFKHTLPGHTLRRWQRPKGWKDNFKEGVYQFLLSKRWTGLARKWRVRYTPEFDDINFMELLQEKIPPGYGDKVLYVVSVNNKPEPIARAIEDEPGHGWCYFCDMPVPVYEKYRDGVKILKVAA